MNASSQAVVKMCYGHYSKFSCFWL